MNESILIFGLLFFIYIFLFINRNNIIYVESKSGTKFMVHKDVLKKEKVSLLEEVVDKMYILKNHLVNNIDKFPEYKIYIEQLKDNFTKSRTIIYETDPESNLTSYSVNKGEELSICLKSKSTGYLHRINLLMYVVIHEMAHFACPDVGHGDLFKKIFRQFIQEAININIYKKEDFEANPVEYCGMILSSSIV
jgi:predicted metal-dependent hydrolase